MKRTLLTVCAVLIFTAVNGVFAEQSDVNLFNELSAAYSSGFYPGAVSYADRLASEYPRSLFIGRALTVKGECLVRLGQTEDALSALEQAQLYVKDDKKLLLACSYWKARALYARADYAEAVSLFHSYCAIGGENGEFFSSCVLYAGRSLYVQNSYKEACPLFEYVVRNGKQYTQTDYAEAVLKLADSYNRSGQFQKTAAVYNSFKLSDFSSDVWYLFTEYAGDAYAGLLQYRKAYDLYCQVLASGQKNLAAGALKKAYNISSAHKTEVGAEPGAVLASAQSALSDSPFLVSEFWVRLGIDAFNAGDYAKAAAYFNSADKDSNRELMFRMIPYRAEMLYAGKASNAGNAATYLQERCDYLKIVPTDESYETIQKLFVKYYAQQKDWTKVKYFAALVKKPDADTVYYSAFASYSTEKYAEAVSIIENSKTGNMTLSTAARSLYARSLQKIGRTSAALSEFASLEAGGIMDDQTRLDYAETLLLAGHLNSAYAQSAKCSLPQALYVGGIALFNNRDWKTAENCFARYRRSSAAVNENETQAYALFYQGYAQYRQGKAADAYANLVQFAQKYPQHALVWNARMTASNAAVQAGRLNDAVIQAQTAVKTAPDTDSYEEAVLLCAGIYTDSKDYDKALGILAPSVQLHTDFGMKCLYQSAQIQVKKGDIQGADKSYLSIIQTFADNPLSEESMYRRGELYYSVQDYATALVRFNDYNSRYAGSRFSDASLYYTADCLAQTGSRDRAILQYEVMLKTYPQSTYVYSAMKNLMNLYSSSGDYSSALNTANALLDKYGDQARADGVTAQAAEFRKYVSGGDAAVVKKQAEYEKKGKLKTVAGRVSGTELAAMTDDADLAESILTVQRKNIPAESMYAAQNADFAAKHNRNAGNAKKAADLYLLAAEYYRMNDKAREAAAALYGAAEAFDSAGMTGDSKETAETLKSLYPDTTQAKNVDKITGR